MTQNENLTLLKDKLCEYFEDKNFDMSEVGNSVFETISRCIDLDYEKLASVLENICLLKQRLDGTRSARYFKFDVSSKTQNVFVKCIFAPGEEPLLMFFNENEYNPFFKIVISKIVAGKKVIIENIGEQVVKDNPKSAKYSFLDEYICDHSGISVKKTTSITNPAEQQTGIAGRELGVTETKFLDLISKGMNVSSGTLENKLSEESLGLILDVLYPAINDANNKQNDFCLSDIITILNGILSDGYEPKMDTEQIEVFANNLSDIAHQISECRDGAIFNFATKNESGDVLFLTTHRSPKFASVDICDANTSLISKYIMMESVNGFTVFKNSKESTSSKPNDTFTFNVSDIGIVFTSHGVDSRQTKYFTDTPTEINIQFLQNGEVSIKSVVLAMLPYKQMEKQKFTAEDILKNDLALNEANPKTFSVSE